MAILASRRRLIAGAVAAAVAGSAIVVTRNALDDDGDRRILDRRGSEPRPGIAPVAILAPASAYRIEYRVETTAAKRTEVAAEVVEVRRPFDAEVTTRRGEPPGRRLLSRQRSTFGAIEVRNPGAAPLLLQGMPDLAIGDVRLDVDLGGLVRDGIAERRGVRRVLGRDCQVYRFGGSVLSGVIARYQRGSTTFADECIDGRGVVLEEVWITRGERVRRKVAVAFSERDVLPRGVEIAGPFLDVKQGGGALRPVDPASRNIGDSYELPTPPGFTLRGRYAVVPAQPIDRGDPRNRARIMAGTADVWVRGVDVIILDQGGTLGSVEPFPEDVTLPEADAGDAGRGRLTRSLRLNEVTALVGAGKYVKVLTTRPPDELRALARQLRKVTGGTGLRYLD